jgi:hypothetical protein
LEDGLAWRVAWLSIQARQGYDMPMPCKKLVVRDQRFTLLFTAAERERLDREAAAAGLDRSAYVRARVFKAAGHEERSERTEAERR